ncbi:hypothetical protein [Microbulbifer sp.]|uniref:hypothetical protein n=1 Tax=Microbulbifer sp. TaxID=1908541 RepID=UPI002F95764F
MSERFSWYLTDEWQVGHCTSELVWYKRRCESALLAYFLDGKLHLGRLSHRLTVTIKTKQLLGWVRTAEAVSAVIGKPPTIQNSYKN